jgi:hypothetical protein
MTGKDLITVATLLALTTLAPAARAAEHVTLRWGSEMDCHHHTQVKGRVRLYLSPGEENYFEFAPEDITGVEFVPDPPPPPPTSAENSPAASKAANSDPRLNPADLHEMLAKAGHEHNLDVDLLASLVKAESGGNARAVSSAGARGLMQLMPGTASDLGVQDSFEPGQNVRGGSAYLDALLTRYNDNMSLALAAYNAGPAAVDKYNGIPPYHETKVYVARVIHEFNRRVRAREAEAKRTASQN